MSLSFENAVLTAKYCTKPSNKQNTHIPIFYLNNIDKPGNGACNSVDRIAVSITKQLLHIQKHKKIESTSLYIKYSQITRYKICNPLAFSEWYMTNSK